MTIECKDLQPRKTETPMRLRDAGRTTDCKDEQYPKADRPMLVRESGRVRDCKDSQFQKALSQTTFVPSLMVYVSNILFLQLSKRFPSRLYTTPNSSATPFFRSSSVTSVEKFSSNIPTEKQRICAVHDFPCSNSPLSNDFANEVVPPNSSANSFIRLSLSRSPK